MNRKKISVIMIFTCFALFSSALLISNFALPQIQAKEPNKGWDYCYLESWDIVNKDITKSVASVYINYFGEDDISVERITATGSEDAHKQHSERYHLRNKAVSKAIFKLGNEGWEMIGQDSSIVDDERKFIYFKRPKK